MIHDVVNLRTVKMGPTHPEILARGEQWMRLADALSEGVSTDYVRDGIGPRVRGMVYRGGYLNAVTTVHDVFVLVAEPGTDPETSKPLPRRAVGWESVEESADDHGWTRRHCTPWAYEVRNQPLFMVDGGKEGMRE